MLFVDERKKRFPTYKHARVFETIRVAVALDQREGHIAPETQTSLQEEAHQEESTYHRPSAEEEQVKASETMKRTRVWSRDQTMAPLTRSRRRRLLHSHILDFLPEDLWPSILSHLILVHDVCRTKEVCHFFGTRLLHDALELRMRALSSRPFTMKWGSTLSMAHAERVWGGIRLTAIDRRSHPEDATRHTDLIALRGDPPLPVGRHNKDCNIHDAFVSRYHLLMDLNLDPLLKHAATVRVIGQNGLRLMPYGNHAERQIPVDMWVKIYVGMEMEICPMTGLFYRVDYL